MIVVKTGKIVRWSVMKKECKTCEVMKREYDDVIPYECFANYEGSSGAMDSKLVVELIRKTWKNSSSMASIRTIVTDDDSTLKANTNNKQHRGLVQDDIQDLTLLLIYSTG